MVTPRIHPYASVLVKTLTDDEFANLVDRNAALAGASRAANVLTINANNYSCTDLTDVTKFIAPSFEFARNDRTSVGSQHVVTEAGRATIDLEAEFYYTVGGTGGTLGVADLILVPGGHKLVHVELVDNRKMTGVFDIVSLAQQPRDTSGDAFWAVTFTNRGHEAPTWVAA